jgi:hypothetical protein
MYDKIIAYDYGAGYYNTLICYRPGSGIAWVIENQGTICNGCTPNWVPVVQNNLGIGGYDLKGPTDQMLALPNYNTGSYQGQMGLALYRPGYGIIWILSHSPYSQTWARSWYSNSGLPNFNLALVQDRLINFDNNNQGLYGPQTLLGYRPGSGNSLVMTGPTGFGGYFGAQGNIFGYPLDQNPNNAPYYIGDKIINFSGDDMGMNSLALYAAGASQVSIIEEDQGMPGYYFSPY